MAVTCNGNLTRFCKFHVGGSWNSRKSAREPTHENTLPVDFVASMQLIYAPCIHCLAAVGQWCLSIHDVCIEHARSHHERLVIYRTAMDSQQGGPDLEREDAQPRHQRSVIDRNEQSNYGQFARRAGLSCTADGPFGSSPPLQNRVSCTPAGCVSLCTFQTALTVRPHVSRDAAPREAG